MSLFDRVGDAVSKRLDVESARMAEQVKQRISIPVDHSTRPPTRSKRGEAPRKDKGKLYASVRSSVAHVADQIDAAISADTEYVRPLNNELNRPVFGDTLETNQRTVVLALAEAVLSVRE